MPSRRRKPSSLQKKAAQASASLQLKVTASRWGQGGRAAAPAAAIWPSRSGVMPETPRPPSRSPFMRRTIPPPMAAAGWPRTGASCCRAGRGPLMAASRPAVSLPLSAAMRALAMAASAAAELAPSRRRNASRCPPPSTTAAATREPSRRASARAVSSRRSASFSSRARVVRITLNPTRSSSARGDPPAPRRRRRPPDRSH